MFGYPGGGRGGRGIFFVFVKVVCLGCFQFHWVNGVNNIISNLTTFQKYFQFKVSNIMLQSKFKCAQPEVLFLFISYSFGPNCL